MSVEPYISKKYVKKCGRIWLQTKVHFKKNLTRQKWNLNGGVKVHVIYNFFVFIG